MATKHQPVTPLPWKVAKGVTERDNVPVIRRDNDEDTTGIAISCVNRILGEPGPSKAEKANAAYIAHSANAYPLLVDRLMTVLRLFEMIGTRNRSENVQYERIKELLHKLGEL